MKSGSGQVASRRRRRWTGPMDRAELLRRISADPAVCFGKPRIRGTRIWVSLLLDFMAGGMTEAEILAEYPDLTVDDLRAALAYGAAAAHERFIPVPSA